MRVLSVLFGFCLGLFSGLLLPTLSYADDAVSRGYADGDESGAFSFNGRIMFYNWGDRASVPSIEEVRAGRFSTLYDSLRSKERRENVDVGADCDFLGNMSLEYLSDAGLSYGVRLQLMIPELANSIDEGKALVNNGNSAFVSTPIGKFSVGYQEGVESSFADIDAKRGEAFDDFLRGRDPTLMKYKLPLLKGDFFKDGEGQWLLHNSVILYPGLYSENIFRANNHLNYYGSSAHSSYFVNSLPFRMSYQSPKLYGMRFGLSYAPFGYRDGLFEGALPEDSSAIRYSPADRSGGGEIGLGGGAREMDLHEGFSGLLGDARVFYKGLFPTESSRLARGRFVYAPNYKGIVSAAWSLNREFEVVKGKAPLKAQLLVAGEYASPSSRFMLAKGVSYPKGWFKDLAAVNVALSAEAGGFTLVGGYGYLGRSGYYEGPIDGTVLSYERRQARTVLKPSYYFVVGGRYSVGPIRVEVSHFSSVKGGYLSLGTINDQGVRVDYELYSGASTKCVLFAQLQRVSAWYSFAQGFVEQAGRRGDVAVSPMKYSFDVLTAGVKVVF